MAACSGVLILGDPAGSAPRARFEFRYEEGPVSGCGGVGHCVEATVPHRGGFRYGKTVAGIPILQVGLRSNNWWEIVASSERESCLIKRNGTTNGEFVLIIFSGWKEFCGIKSLPCSSFIGVGQLR